MYLCLILLKEFDCKENADHNCKACSENDVYVLYEACENVAYKADRGDGQCIRKLSGHVVYVITLSACRGHDSRIGDR